MARQVFIGKSYAEKRVREKRPSLVRIRVKKNRENVSGDSNRGRGKGPGGIEVGKTKWPPWKCAHKKRAL